MGPQGVDDLFLCVQLANVLKYLLDGPPGLEFSADCVGQSLDYLVDSLAIKLTLNQVMDLLSNDRNEDTIIVGRVQVIKNSEYDGFSSLLAVHVVLQLIYDATDLLRCLQHLPMIIGASFELDCGCKGRHPHQNCKGGLFHNSSHNIN